MVYVSVGFPLFIVFNILMNLFTSSSLSNRGILNNLNSLVPGPESMIELKGNTDKMSIMNQPVV